MGDFVEIKCCACAVVFGLNRSYYEGAKQAGPQLWWHCPNGHKQHFPHGPSEADKLRKERDTLKQQMAYKEDRLRAEVAQREAAQNSARAFKGVATRMKNRVSRGVCPCCNRTFADLQRHMATKHKGYEAAEITIPATEMIQ